MSTTTDLTGQLLVASPAMTDPRFEGSVVYLVVHSAEGAMGLIVNKPTPEVRLANLLTQMKVPHEKPLPDIRVHFGGPVEQSRGFVLHTPDVTFDDATLQVDDTTAMTASVEILSAIGQGKGPKSSLLALGYSGWGPGQLESEIGANGWITAPASPDILFGRAHEYKWNSALKSIGIDPSSLSSTAGRA